MGLFDKLFQKKICDICGGEIGLLGNRKLEDGNCCKDCAKKLSPWFDDRRSSTIEQIKAQLAAREENHHLLQSWNHDLVYGEWQKIYIRRVNGVPESFVICSVSNYKEENADIIPIKNVVSCELDIREDRDELKQKNAQGEMVSYNPPRYEYSYEFYINLMVSGFDYIDDMRLRMNRSTLHLETAQGFAGRGFASNLAFKPMLYPEYRELKAACDEVCQIIEAGRQGQVWPTVVATPVAAPATPTEPVAPVTPAAPAAAATWVCEYCGSENTGKFCQDCGAARPAKEASDWKCFCGTVNTGRFCQNCGIQRFKPEDISCSECSWTIEEPGQVPKFCPSCDKEFNNDDLDR